MKPYYSKYIYAVRNELLQALQAIFSIFKVLKDHAQLQLEHKPYQFAQIESFTFKLQFSGGDYRATEYYFGYL